MGTIEMSNKTSICKLWLLLFKFCGTPYRQESYNQYKIHGMMDWMTFDSNLGTYSSTYKPGKMYRTIQR